MVIEADFKTATHFFLIQSDSLICNSLKILIFISLFHLFGMFIARLTELRFLSLWKK